MRSRLPAPGLERFARDDEGSALVHPVRRAYRHVISLEFRLQLRSLLLKLIRGHLF